MKISSRDLLLMLALYIAGLITYWNVTQKIYFFNDIGYHAHMAQMLINQFPWYPPYDPRWRLGILVNYPMLFPLILAGASVVTGTTPWQIYPYVILMIHSIIPCSTYYLFSRTGSWKGGIIAGALLLLATMNPDQNPQILAMVFVPLTILYFLQHLERRTWKSGALFGLFVALIFCSHFYAFVFFTLTFIIFGLMFMGAKTYLGFLEHINEEKDFKECENFHAIKSLLISTLMAIIVFFAITGVWWFTTFNYYGANAFNSPFTRLSREEVVLTSVPLGTFFRTYPMMVILIILSILAVGFCVVKRPREYSEQKFLIYLAVAWILSFILTFPLETFGVWYGEGWRHLFFLIFVCQLFAGIGGEKIIEFFFNRLRVEKSFRTSFNLQRIESFILLSFLIFMVVIAVNINTKLNLTVASPPIKEPEANIKAMMWLDNIAGPSDVVVADTAHSSWLLYFADVSTLSGVYGTTNPDTEKDRAVAIILCSDNYTETIEAFEKYSVDYVYVDTTTIHGGVFEIAVHWHNIWREEEPQVNVEKLRALCGDPIYNKEGIIIFKVPEGED